MSLMQKDIVNQKPAIGLAGFMGEVPMEGFEPPRAYAHCVLNAARLPVPPHRLVVCLALLFFA